MKLVHQFNRLRVNNSNRLYKYQIDFNLMDVFMVSQLNYFVAKDSDLVNLHRFDLDAFNVRKHI